MEIPKDLFVTLSKNLGPIKDDPIRESLKQSLDLNPFDMSDVDQILGKFIPDIIWKNPTKNLLFQVFGDDDEPGNPYQKFINNIPLSDSDLMTLKEVVHLIMYEDDCNYPGTLVYKLTYGGNELYLFTEHLGDTRSDDQVITPIGVFLSIEEGMKELYTDGSF